MIINFPTYNNKTLIELNYEAAKRFHCIVLYFFNVMSHHDIHWYSWAQSWLDDATTRMIEHATSTNI